MVVINPLTKQIHRPAPTQRGQQLGAGSVGDNMVLSGSYVMVDTKHNRQIFLGRAVNYFLTLPPRCCRLFSSTESAGCFNDNIYTEGIPVQFADPFSPKSSLPRHPAVRRRLLPQP